MARLTAQTKAKRLALKPAPERPELAERSFRQAAAWIVLCLVLIGDLGLGWDRRWHDILGRDQFWIPPHILMYTAVGGTGLIALFVVLLETRRYYQKRPGVDDASTVRVLRYFHAPLGFVLLGFGTLNDIIAAPLDNYWHQLYGIDVTLWSPFHLMGVFGAITVGLGIIYTFASEAAYEREANTRRRFLGFNAAEWGIMVLLAGYQELVPPALTAFTSISLGRVQLLTYPLILALTTSLCLISAYLCIRKQGATTITALIFWVMSALTELFVALAIRFMANRLGLIYRVGRSPIYNVTLALLPILTVLCALLIEATVHWQRRSGKSKNGELRGAWILGIIIAVPAVVIPPAIVYAFNTFAPSIPMPPDIGWVLKPGPLDMLVSLPPAMLVGAVMAYLGTVFGDIWHWSKQ